MQLALSNGVATEKPRFVAIVAIFAIGVSSVAFPTMQNVFFIVGIFLVVAQFALNLSTLIL